jgi:hypothetical protein
VKNSTISGNATGAGGNGGRSFGSGYPGTGGDGGDGGGIYNVGMLDVTNSTFSANTNGQGGTGDSFGFVNGIGGNGGGGGIYNAGTVDVTSSTASGNTTGAGGNGGSFGGTGGSAGSGGGIDNDFGTVNVGATIVANSEGTHGGDCNGGITDEGYNLDSDGSCGLTTSSPYFDLPSTDPEARPPSGQRRPHADHGPHGGEPGHRLRDRCFGAVPGHRPGRLRPHGSL